MEVGGRGTTWLKSVLLEGLWAEPPACCCLPVVQWKLQLPLPHSLFKITHPFMNKILSDFPIFHLRYLLIYFGPLRNRRSLPHLPPKAPGVNEIMTFHPNKYAVKSRWCSRAWDPRMFLMKLRCAKSLDTSFYAFLTNAPLPHLK